MALGSKSNFLLGKAKQSVFLDFGRIIYQISFFGFPWKKVGFPLENHLFSWEKLKNNLLRVWAHSVFKDGF